MGGLVMEQWNIRLPCLRFHSTFADLGCTRAIFQGLKEAGANQVSSWLWLPCSGVLSLLVVTCAEESEETGANSQSWHNIKRGLQQRSASPSSQCNLGCSLNRNRSRVFGSNSYISSRLVSSLGYPGYLPHAPSGILGFDGFGAPLPGQPALRTQLGGRLSSFFLCGKVCCWTRPATIVCSLTRKLSSAADSVPNVASGRPKLNAFGLAIPRIGLVAATSRWAWEKSSVKGGSAREIEINIISRLMCRIRTSQSIALSEETLNLNFFWGRSDPMALYTTRFFEQRYMPQELEYPNLKYMLVEYESRCAPWIIPFSFDQQDSPARNMHILCSWGDFLFYDKTSSVMYVNLIQVIRRRNLVRKETTQDSREANGIILCMYGCHRDIMRFAPFDLPKIISNIIVTKRSGFLESDFETWQSDWIVRPIVSNFKETAPESTLAARLVDAKSCRSEDGPGKVKHNFNSQPVAPRYVEAEFRSASRLVKLGRSAFPS